ncbi:unnamed protein product, partial [Urochloa humidicola]
CRQARTERDLSMVCCRARGVNEPSVGLLLATMAASPSFRFVFDGLVCHGTEGI